MPGEVATLPEGGDFILDESASASSAGYFEYAGHKFRSVNAEEYETLNKITANTALRKQFGPRRLSVLDQNSSAQDEKTKQKENPSINQQPVQESPEQQPTPEKTEPDLVPEPNTEPKDPENKHKEDKPPAIEKSVDPDKLRFIRDLGPGNRWKGFGTPRQGFYVDPDAPRNADGSMKRYSIEEYNKLKEQKKARVGELAGTKENKGYESFDKRDYVGVKVKTLRDVAKGPDAEYFGEMFNAIDKQSADILARAYQGDKLTEEEEKKLQYALHEYSKFAEKYEKIEKEIKFTHLELAGRRNPAIQRAIELNGPAETLKFWKQDLKHLAMTDRETFTFLYDAVKHTNKGMDTRRYKKFNENVLQVCKRAGISPEEYDAVFQLKRGDKKQSEKWLKLHLSKDLTGFAKIAGSLGVTHFKARSIMREAQRLQNVVDRKFNLVGSAVRDIHKEMGIVGRVMALSIGDPMKVAALRKAAMRNEAVQLARDGGPKNMSEMKSSYTNIEANVPNDAALKEMFERDKPKEWATWDQSRRERWRDHEWDPSELKQPDKEAVPKGLWAQILYSFTKWLIGSRKKKLSVA